MLQRNRVALAWSAGLAMVLVMSSPASAQIQDPGLAWVTIYDEGTSPTVSFGTSQSGTGLFDAPSSGPTGSGFIGEYNVASPVDNTTTEYDFLDPQNGATPSAILTISFSKNTDTNSPNNQIVRISYGPSVDVQLPSPKNTFQIFVVDGYLSFGTAGLGANYSVPDAPLNFVVNVGSGDVGGVPEIDPASAGGALACLVSGVLMLTARRKRVTT